MSFRLKNTKYADVEFNPALISFDLKQGLINRMALI